MSQEGKAHGAADGFPSVQSEEARLELTCSHTPTHHIGNGRKRRRRPYRKMALAPLQNTDIFKDMV